MCLIIHRPAGKRVTNVPVKVLDHNRHQNPDGFGVAWRHPEKGLKYEKFDAGQKNYDRFKKLVLKLDASEVEYVAHFRKATHGKVCKEMSHPFAYQDPNVGEVLVFHNGIINIGTEGRESDTAAFVRQILANMESAWWKNPSYRYLIENSIGWSRLLIMTKDETIRFKVKDWVDEQGISYSCSPMPSYLMKSGKGSYDDNGWPKDSKLRVPYSYGFNDEDEADWDDDDDEDEESEYLDGIGVGSKRVDGWPDGNQRHFVVPQTEEVYDDGAIGDPSEKYGKAMCVTCNATGEYYIIWGKAYIEVKHSYKKGELNDSERGLTVTVEADAKAHDVAKAIAKAASMTPVKSAKESAKVLLPTP